MVAGTLLSPIHSRMVGQPEVGQERFWSGLSWPQGGKHSSHTAKSTKQAFISCFGNGRLFGRHPLFGRRNKRKMKAKKTRDER
jgi:hypothetical protein